MRAAETSRGVLGSRAPNNRYIAGGERDAMMLEYTVQRSRPGCPSELSRAHPSHCERVLGMIPLGTAERNVCCTPPTKVL